MPPLLLPPLRPTRTYRQECLHRGSGPTSSTAALEPTTRVQEGRTVPHTRRWEGSGACAGTKGGGWGDRAHGDPAREREWRGAWAGRGWEGVGEDGKGGRGGGSACTGTPRGGDGRASDHVHLCILDSPEARCADYLVRLCRRATSRQLGGPQVKEWNLSHEEGTRSQHNPMVVFFAGSCILLPR